MYRNFVLAVAGVFCTLAHAEGYFGAVVAISSAGIDCAGSYSCDRKARAVKLYAGEKIKENDQIDLGVGRVNAVEFGAINFGKVRASFVQGYYENDLVNGGVSPAPVDHDVSKVGTANALYVAAVGSAGLTEELSLAIKLGAAYVSSTIRTSVNGAMNGSETATKIKPYVGLGLEYEAVKGVKFVGSFDWTQFDVAAQKGSLKALGVGAEVAF